MMTNENFVSRLQKAFGGATMAGVARRLGIPHATVRNYYQGRLPAPEVLIKIAAETGVSLNWLLMGTGQMFASDIKGIDLGRLLEQKLDELIEEKLRLRNELPVELGDIDGDREEFDVVTALNETDDPQIVMRRWLEYEGREYPQDFGIVFFKGWETFSSDQKAAAVRDAKHVLDRTLDGR